MNEQPITHKTLMEMSDEQVRELNRKMGKRALLQFAGFMAIKWGLIYGINKYAHKK